jgi:hypothetical protein
MLGFHTGNGRLFITFCIYILICFPSFYFVIFLSGLLLGLLGLCVVELYMIPHSGEIRQVLASIRQTCQGTVAIYSRWQWYTIKNGAPFGTNTNLEVVLLTKIFEGLKIEGETCC